MRTCPHIPAGEKLSEGLARSTFPATCRRDGPRGTNDSYVRLGLPPDERGWHGEGLIGHRSAIRLFAPRAQSALLLRAPVGGGSISARLKPCPDTLVLPARPCHS